MPLDNQSLKRYRKNVAIVVINDTGHILACERNDYKGAWQIPQGGIEAGETAEEALWRELLEEIGTREATLIGKLSETICYDWPEHLHSRDHHGQEQTYFLVRLSERAEIRFDSHHQQEFQAYEWLSAADFLSRISGFKAEAYRQGIEGLNQSFPETINMGKAEVLERLRGSR